MPSARLADFSSDCPCANQPNPSQLTVPKPWCVHSIPTHCLAASPPCPNICYAHRGDDDEASAAPRQLVRPLPQFDLAELDAARQLLNDEVQVVLAAMGHGGVSQEEYLEAWRATVDEWVLDDKVREAPWDGGGPQLAGLSSLASPSLQLVQPPFPCCPALALACLAVVCRGWVCSPSPSLSLPSPSFFLSSCPGALVHSLLGFPAWFHPPYSLSSPPFHALQRLH